MGIQGLRATDSFDTDARPLNWRAGILRRYPNGKAVLTALTSLMPKAATDDPTFNWWQQVLTSQRAVLGANLDDGSSGTVQDITVAADPAGEEEGGARQFVEGHILRVEETGEILLVTQDPTSDTVLRVQRSFGTVAATTVDYDGAGVNPNLHCIGNVFEEGSDAPTAVMYDPTKYYNYTQTFRNTLEATRRALKTRLRTVEHAREAKRQCAELHAIEMEKAFLFGERWEGTRKGKPATTTGGIVNFIHADNVFNGGGASGIDMETLEGFLEQAFRFGSSEKLVLCGNLFLLGIQRIVRRNAAIQIFSGIKEFGMNVTRIDTPFGSIVCKTHPLMNQLTGGTTTGTAYYGINSWGIGLDMAEFRYRYLTDSDTKYQPVLQANGIDGMKSGYLTDAGLEIHHSRNHFRFYNLVTGVADT